MLAASIHEHAGLGNQLWRYVCCRVFAENHGYEFGVSHPGWRGKFLNIDWGREVPINIEEDFFLNFNDDSRAPDDELTPPCTPTGSKKRHL